MAIMLNRQQEMFRQYVTSNVPIENKIILDLACDRSLSLVQAFLHSGAKQVWGNNYEQIYNKEQISNFKFIRGDFTKINIDESYFDIIYSRATLEHFPEIEPIIEKSLAILKNNGTAFFSGGPMWTSMRGHHVWLKHGQNSKTVKNSYTFTDNNPLEPWEHLIYENDHDLLIAKLSDRGIPYNDIIEIINNIFDNPYISSNRLSVEQIICSIQSEIKNFICEIRRFQVIESNLNTLMKTNLSKVLEMEKYKKHDLLTNQIFIKIVKNII